MEQTPPTQSEAGLSTPVAGPPATDPGDASLTSALRSGFNVLRVVMVILIVLYFLSGRFEVRDAEFGLVARFGELKAKSEGELVYEPGWHVSLPDPFDEKLVLPSSNQTLIVDRFAYSRPPRDAFKPLSETSSLKQELTPGVDGALLTGDRNLSHGRFLIEYRVVDPVRFAMNVPERIADEPEGPFMNKLLGSDLQREERYGADAVEPLLQRLAETAVLRTAASKTVEEVLYRGRAELAAEIQRRLQRMVDALDLGVRIVQVTPETIEPGATRDAFRNVVTAEQQKRARIQEAETEAARILTRRAGQQYTELLPLIDAYGDAQTTGASEAELATLLAAVDEALSRAGGEVAELIRTAEGDASAEQQRIVQELDEFQYYIEQYRQDPEVTAMLLWTDLVRAILPQTNNEIFLVPSGAENDPVTIVINRDELRKLMQEQERVRARFVERGGESR